MKIKSFFLLCYSNKLITFSFGLALRRRKTRKKYVKSSMVQRNPLNNVDFIIIFSHCSCSHWKSNVFMSFNLFSIVFLIHFRSFHFRYSYHTQTLNKNMLKQDPFNIFKYKEYTSVHYFKFCLIKILHTKNRYKIISLSLVHCLVWFLFLLKWKISYSQQSEMWTFLISLKQNWEKLDTCIKYSVVPT